MENEIERMTPQELRSTLITFAIMLSYIVFMTMGMIIRKHFPIVDRYLDIAFIPVGLSTILFLYLFAVTYEKRMSVILSPEVLAAGKLYGSGMSFEEIKNEMQLSNISQVKTLITKFCKGKT